MAKLVASNAITASVAPTTNTRQPPVLAAEARFGWTIAGAPTSITFSASIVGHS